MNTTNRRYFGRMHIQDASEYASAEIWIMPDDKGVYQVQFFGERADGTEWLLTEPKTAKMCDSLALAAKFARVGGYPVDGDDFKPPKLREFSFESPTRPDIVPRSVLLGEDAEKLAVCMWKTALPMCADVWFVMRDDLTKTDP